MKEFGFKGKVAVVTGAGSGMGRELCAKLAKEGCSVIGADVNERYLQGTVDMVTAGGGAMAGRALDVADRAAVQRFAGEVAGGSGRVDIVMNNAGVAMSDKTAEEISFDDFEWIVNINMWGVINVAKAFIPQLKKSDDAYLVNTSSIYGLFGMENAAAYTTSKFAVRGFSETLCQELHGSPVNVMTVFPGGIRTNIGRDARWLGDAADVAGQKKALQRFENSVKTTAAEAADGILQAMRKRKKRLLIGSDAKFMDLYVRLNPSEYDGFVRKHITRGTRAAQGS